MTAPKTSFYQHTLPELRTLFEQHGLPPSGPGLLFNWHYKKRRAEPCVADLARVSRDFVAQRFHFDLPRLHLAQESSDRTVKFLFELADGRRVETVLIPFTGKYALCLSSQVGCAMKCSFCHTGEQGFTRNLSTDEILGQFLGAQAWLTRHRPGDERILNIVFMGQGEPLHNFDAVRRACEILMASHGPSLADHRITVSTAGYVPGLKRWRAEMPGVNIALSLHSPFPHKRSELIPLNRHYPLAEVLALLDELPLGRKRFVTYEYLLVDGFNDGAEDAHAVAELLRERQAFLNLIPFNPYPGSAYRRPAPERVRDFKAILDSYRIPATIRGTKGDEILAACGQLNTRAT